MSERPKVLIIDDGLDYAQVVAERMPEVELLHPHGQPAARFADGPAALAFLADHHSEVDVILLDVYFDVPSDRLLPLGPGFSARRTKRFQGVAILRALREQFPQLPVVLLTGLEDLSLVDVDGALARQSMTYFLDVNDLDTLRVRLHAAIEARAASSDDGDGILWGRGTELQSLKRRLRVLSRGTRPVILEGETGTGKSFLAERFIHRHSGRQGPFVTVDLSTIPTDLIPAHLFGALRGAYTGAVSDRKGVFELAHRGTLFIDEIQNVPPEIQKQLLLVLQDRRVRPLGAAREVPVDVKVVAGSNADLAAEVAAGRFRQDLYMRLGPATRIRLPPLRERGAELLAYARHFAAAAAQDVDNADLYGRVARAAGVAVDSPLGFRVGRRKSSEVDGPGLELHLAKPSWRLIREHPWPGNVRELAYIMHNLVTFTLVGVADLLRSGKGLENRVLQVDPGLVGQLLSASVPTQERDATEGERLRVEIAAKTTLNAVSVAVERQYFEYLFRKLDGNFARMAEALLGDPDKARAVRLRFNQIGLRVRDLR